MIKSFPFWFLKKNMDILYICFDESINAGFISLRRIVIIGNSSHSEIKNDYKWIWISVCSFISPTYSQLSAFNGIQFCVDLKKNSHKIDAIYWKILMSAESVDKFMMEQHNLFTLWMRDGFMWHFRMRHFENDRSVAERNYLSLN